MDLLFEKEIFRKLETDYAKIKIERFRPESYVGKLNITDNFRMRMDYVLRDYENIRVKKDFIRKLFEEYDVKVTLNFKNENCIIKFFNEDDFMRFRIEFKIENLIVKYKNSSRFGLYDWDKYELRLLNKGLLH